MKQIEGGGEPSLQLLIEKCNSAFVDGAFGIPPTGRDRQATLKQSKLPWDSSSSHFTVLLYTCGALRGVVKIGTHSSQSPACQH